MHIILIFVDGIGIADLNPHSNPFYYSKTALFKKPFDLPYNGQFFALDPILQTPGLPQSATGQCSIYTGINCAGLIGRHLYGFPNTPLVDVLKTRSIFIALKSMGFACQFVNAFRPIFFTTPELFRGRRMSATTEMNRSAQLTFCTLRDVIKKKALYHDYTNQELISKGFAHTGFSASLAAQILLKNAKKYHLVLYEYFLTDIAGHKQDMHFAKKILNDIESLIFSLLCNLGDKNTAVLVVSDHGNFEDLSTKSHTLNPAYMAVWNNKTGLLPRNLTDIYPLILELVQR